MKKNLMIAIILLACFSASGLLAQGRGMRGPGMMGEGMGPHDRGDFNPYFFGVPDEMKKNLDLSDSQVEAITQKNEEIKNEHLRLRDLIRPKIRQLRAILLKDDVNIDQVRTMLKEISDIEIEIRLLKIKHRLAIEKILTPDQKNKMKKEIRRRHMHDD